MKEGKHLYIDLHGKSVQEAKKILATKFAIIKEENYVEFYIITGRGNHIAPNGARGVLKKMLPKLLKPYCEDILEIEPEIGSYKIRLKKNDDGFLSNLKTMLSVVIDSENQEEQINFLKKKEALAEKGDLNAMLLMANIHLGGEFKEFRDQEKALQWLHHADTRGSLEAKTGLGVFYIEGQYLKKNFKKGFRLLKAAAESGNPLGQFYLAKFYALGQGIKQSDEKALFWTQKAADQGFPTAEFNLGFSYFEGNFTPQNDALAFKYLTQAADHGHIESKVYLARCYACGYGTAKDDQMALHLYRKAALFDNTYALFNAGIYYLQGRGTKANPHIAFRYFHRGAQLKDGDSQAYLAGAYLFGNGIPQNIKAGLSWAQKSAEQKNPRGYYMLSLAHKHGLGVEANPEKEREFLEKSAQGGWEDTQYLLGLAIIRKQLKGTLEEGLTWLQKAADQNYSPAVKALESTRNLVSSLLPKGHEPLTSIPSLISAFSQTIYNDNKSDVPKNRSPSLAPPAKEPKKDDDDSHPTYPGLRRGFLN